MMKESGMNNSNSKFTFKPRARMLLLLGDQLIRNPGIAVFELVKNAYDADSPAAIVTMSNITDDKLGKIIVEDTGTGMDYETVTNVWMEPGTDYRARQRASGERTPKYHRLPLGEKGVGRFAAHKLGNHIRLVTRKKDNPEIRVEIDWTQYAKHKYLDEIPVNIIQREPRVFQGNATGTRIVITKLRNTWNRGMVRELARSINSICSPFEKLHTVERKKAKFPIGNRFKASLVLEDNQEWLKGILDVDQVLEYALFRGGCNIEGNVLTYDYGFKPYREMDKVESRNVSKRTMVIKEEEGIDLDVVKKHIGPIRIDLYIYDRETKILMLGVSDRKGLKEFLDENGGVRVYRQGIRVYDYGEPGNDWLNLGALRVNVPAGRISNNLVIGAVSLTSDENIVFDPNRNLGLIEKTNREGFVDNPSFRAFKHIVTFALQQVTAERNIDKLRIRNAYSSSKLKEPVIEDLTDLRDLIEKKGLTEELGHYVDRIEADFVLIRDRFLTSASAGLSLSTVIHEVEKGIEELVKAVEEDQATPRVKDLAKHLSELVEGFAFLIRRSGMSREKASALIKQARFNTELRLKVHNIEATVDIDQGDFEVKCSRRLTVATLMNLIDNSIWWLDNKWGDLQNKKRIYIGISKEFKEGPAIVVADNGPGFIDPPEYLVQPFISRKPDGMGLGLHIAEQVMKGQEGRLGFPEVGDLSLPKGFDGAVVALIFRSENK
jgi:signal transduction histidine kinase